MGVLSHRRLSTREFDCLFNTQRLEEAEVRRLLAPGGDALLQAGRELPGSGLREPSYIYKHGGRSLLMRRMEPESLYRRLRGALGKPPTFRCFRKAARLIKAQVRTPMPVLAAVLTINGSQRELLFTDYHAAAEPLDAYLSDVGAEERQGCLLELADFLTHLHSRGFYTCELSSRHILVEVSHGRRVFFMTNLPAIHCSRMLKPQHFVRTVAAAAGDLWKQLSEQDRRYLFAACFDYALKKNIYSEPSQQASFVEKVTARVRGGESKLTFFLRWNW